MVVASIKEKITESFSMGSYGLASLDGFPYEEWSRRKSEYEEKERWFTGQALNDQPELAAEGKKADLYPMRINPLISTVLKHAYILFGEVEDDGRPLVWPKLIAKGDDKSFAEEAEETLNTLWWENSARALMSSNAIISQIYGGCIFKAISAPWEKWRSIPIKIERVNPKNFVGYPDGSNPFRLSEAWFVREISGKEAKRWGYTKADPDLSYWYAEHWMPDSYEITINGQPAKFIEADGKEHELSGENPWGFVPGVYIPHVRVVNFYGANTFDHLKGYVKEMNRVIGDYGDAVNDDAHPIIAIRDVQGSVQMKRVNAWLETVDLGSSPNITGGERPPDMFEVRNTRASVAMQKLYDEVYAQYRRDSFVPAVADGEDEGSQRSALTLATRFWPLTSHAGLERRYWTSGMDVFQSMLLSMMAERGILDERHLGMRMKQKWAPMLPRDREADVAEWQLRSQAHLGSIEHILELSGDVEDTSEERENIIQDIRDITQAEEEEAAKAVKKFPPPIQNTPFGGNSND